MTPDPENPVIKTFLRYVNIRPEELPLPERKQQSTAVQRPPLADQFVQPHPTVGQRILHALWRL